MVRLSRAAAVIAVLLFAAPAAGQDREADAERLFREGQKLLEERRYGEACPKFEQAYRKDGQLGTLINLAFCHKEQGASWYAWLEFREAEVKAAEQKRAERKQFARKRLDELERTLPKVIIDNPRKVPLTEVLVEDRRVPEAERGAYFTAEEGKRKLTFRAKGKKAAVELVTIKKGERVQHVAVPEMEDAPAASVDAAAPVPGSSGDDGAGDAREPANRDAPSGDAAAGDDPGGTQRTLAYGALALGGAGLVAGSVFGYITLTTPCTKTSASQCNGTPAEREAQRAKADTPGLVSTIGFVVAGVGGVTGLVLLLTAPSRSTDAHATSTSLAWRPELGPGWAGVTGTF
jgi:hypothetical protein